MKSKIFRISKRTISLLLSIIMVFSMMLVGMVSTSAAAVFPNSLKIFVDVGSSGFDNDDATIDAYFFGTSGYTWVQMSEENGLFACLTPATGTYENVIFSRSENHACNFDSDWNQTKDIAYEANKNKYTFSDFQGNGSWSLTTMNWYLSGTLNGIDTGNTSPDYLMSHTSNGVYTFQKKFNDSTDGYQYVTVNDGYNSYHPENNNSDSGTIGSHLGANGGNDPKWRVSAKAGVTVTFSWDSFARTLSWVVDGGSSTLSAAPSSVINGTDVMFYIKSYNHNDNKRLGLTNGSATTYKTATHLGTDSDNVGYITISKTDCASYYYITNNWGNWVGNEVSDIKTAEGGEYFNGAGGSTVAATTAETTLSDYELLINTDTTLTLSTTCSKATSSYGSNLYIQYYLNDELVVTDADIAASTSTNTYNLDISSYNAGEYTLKTVLTDGNVYYIAATTEFSIVNKTTFKITPKGGSNGKVEYSVDTDFEIQQGTPVTITATPDPGYRLHSITSDDGTEIEVTGNTGTFTMPSNDIKITTTFVPYEAYGKVMCRSLNPDTNELGALTQDTTGVSGLVEITGTPGATVYTATANDNYQFMGWYTDADCTEIYSGLTSEFVLTQDLTLYAYFVQTILPKHTLTLQSVENVTASISAQNGSVTIDAGNSEEVNVGATVTLTLSELASNHRVTSVTVNGTEISGSDNTYTFTMPAEDAAVVVTVAEIKTFNITATVNDATMGTVSPTSETAIEGENVSFTATPVTGYEFVNWTVTGLNSSTPTLTSPTLSFQVQASDSSTITVMANFKVESHRACNYRITGSTDLQYFEENWTNDYTKAKEFETYVKEGVYKTTIVVPYTDDGKNQFRLINSSNTQYYAYEYYNILNCTTEENPYEAKVFSESKNTFYFGSTGRYDLYIKDSDTNPKIWAVKSTDVVLINDDFNVVGTFDSEGKIVLNLPAGSSERYFVVDADGYMHINGGGKIDDAGSLNLSKYNNLYDTPNYFTHNASFGGTYTFTISNNYDKITVSSENAGDYVKIYAKDGTIRSTDNYAYQKYANMADSTFTSNVEKISSDTYYESGYAKKGSTITVNTTISENYRSTYYVKAFSVNGVSYRIIDSSKADKTNGVYTLTYTVPDDFSDKFIEITPIYFYINETDTATFYVENFNDEVQAEWGNTIACHAYYEGGSDTAGFGASNKNALGGYPGQPMVNEGGKLYVQVPLHLDSEKKIKIKGITLNNYVWDDIHSIGKDQKNDNCQTYDYDDFVRIADLGTADNIIFTFKYRTSVDNSPSTVPNDTNKDAVFTNGWEDLTDYYGRKVDVFGNILSDTQISSSTPLRIVSNGYIDNHIGDYATEWNIYALNGSTWSKIATIPSSVLLYPTSGDIPTEASDYKTAYTALEAYENVPAIITYEKSIESKGSGGQLGDRADGRWYYSKTGDIVTSNIVIEYADDEKSTFVEDEFKDDTVVGTITGASAYFTNSEYYGTTSITTVLDSSQYFNLHTEENATTGYMFYGWYLKNTDGTYTWMSNDADYNVPISGSDTFVARYIKIPEGDLLITHTLYSSISDLLTQYTGDDVPNTGSGNCYLKVEILDASGNVVRTFGSETSTASVHLTSNYIKYDSDYSIQVYIYTDPLGNDAFLKYYVNNHKPANTDRYCNPMIDFIENADGTAYLKMPAFTVKSLFKVTETDSGTTYENTVSSLDFYSDIAPVTKDYKITYTYDSRLYGEKDYVVKGVIDSVFIETHGTDELTADFVKKNAPFVDDFGKKITWDLDNIVINNELDVATAAVSSSKDVHYVTLTSVGSDGSEGNTLTFAYGALAKHGNIIKGIPDTTGEDDDFIYIADAENTDGEKFNHWAIYNNERKLVSRCYSASFNYVLYDNYTIEAVYGDDYSKYEDISSTIDLLEYTRNQWTDEDGNKTDDYLYSDFALAYNYNHKLISSLDPSNVEVGIAFEVCGKIVQEPDGTYDNSDLEMKYGAGITTNDEALKSAILASTVNGKTTYNVDDSTKRNLFCYQIANEKLNNKNRIEYYLEFKNTESNQMYIMKVYSYIIVDGMITLSKPEYINLYDIANCEYVIG